MLVEFGVPILGLLLCMCLLQHGFSCLVICLCGLDLGNVLQLIFVCFVLLTILFVGVFARLGWRWLLVWCVLLLSCGFGC